MVKSVNDVVKDGSVVSLHYTGTLEDGTVFDSSEGREPLEFTVGEKMVIEGFESGVIGLSVGEEKEIIIPPEKGYGVFNDKLIIKFPKTAFGANVDKIEKGVVLRLMSPEGLPTNARVVDVSENDITLDLNHPLAGKTLNFKVKIVSIENKG